jgi:hypothetical protein
LRDIDVDHLQALATLVDPLICTLSTFVWRTGSFKLRSNPCSSVCCTNELRGPLEREGTLLLWFLEAGLRQQQAIIGNLEQRPRWTLRRSSAQRNKRALAGRNVADYDGSCNVSPIPGGSIGFEFE